MATTGPRVVKAALATLLEAKGALSGVTIYTFTVDTGSLKTREWLILGDIDGDVDWNTMGGTVLSEYTITCNFSVHQPPADATADRAWAILDAVSEVLVTDWTVTANTLDAAIAQFSIEETIDPAGGRRAVVEFTIKVRDLSA